ncbi:MAG: hypothetical protein JRI25_01995 [Deltaproteobacteria bacterium]|nr:hypothetical protein [Deltaproteobacteria bacterium]
MWIWLVVAWALADCPEDPVGQVRGSAAAMEVAFVGLDEEGFDSTHARLTAAIPCIVEPLALRDILALHRASALAAFMDGDMVASRKSWGAVRTLHPDWVPPSSMIPEGHLLRGLFDEAPTDPEVVALDMAPPGGWLVDGREATGVPAQRAFVLQGIDEGAVGYTGYHHSVAEIPVLDFAEPISRVSPRAKKIRKTGTLVAGGMAAGALAGLGVHLHARSAVLEVPYDKVDGTVTRANVSGVSAVALGAGAVGLTAVAWAVRW